MINFIILLIFIIIYFIHYIQFIWNYFSNNSFYIKKIQNFLLQQKKNIALWLMNYLLIISNLIVIKRCIIYIKKTQLRAKLRLQKR